MKTSKEKLKELKKYFSYCLEGKYPYLKFTLENDWLSVEYLNILNYMPSEENPAESYGYKTLASQRLNDYDDDKIINLVNRVNLRLACELASKNQDLNGIQAEYNLVKK